MQIQSAWFHKPKSDFRLLSTDPLISSVFKYQQVSKKAKGIKLTPHQKFCHSLSCGPTV